jgi:predicted ATP-dependent Lon-type protease
MEIVLGRTYNYWDDGKRSPSRRHDVKIIDMLHPFLVPWKIRRQWKRHVKTCYWLFAKKTDFFLKAILSVRNEDRSYSEEIIYFVRTVDGGWFSLGFWGGRLEEKD